MGQHLIYLFQQIIIPVNLLYIVVGNLIGIIFGSIPGLSGTMAVMLFMPLTYTMPSSSAIIFLISLWVGGCSGGFIGSVLLGIPGSPSSVATCWDGYPMAQKGEAGKALAIGMVACAIGTVGSAVIGLFLAEKVADVAFMLGPWEYFSLCLLAITMVLAISKGNMFRGLASACLGLIFSSVGYSPIDAEARFSFGNNNLAGGLSMIVVLTGIFMVSQIIYDMANGYDKTPDVDTSNIKGLGITWKELKEQMRNILQSFFVGLGIGFLPGMGAGLSNIVAYSTAKASSKHPENFGKGEPAGVWAPEVANNASVGGALIPMTALGIPGDTTTAFLIGALTIHGLEMGPMVFKNSGHIITLMFGTVVICGIVVLLMESLGMRVFPYVLKVPHQLMYSSLLIVCVVSAYVDSANLTQVAIMLVFGCLGIFMKWANLPTSPFMLAFILGPIIEKNMLQAFQYSGTWTSFFTRPVSCVLMILVIVSIFMPVLRSLFGKKAAR